MALSIVNSKSNDVLPSFSASSSKPSETLVQTTVQPLIEKINGKKRKSSSALKESSAKSARCSRKVSQSSSKSKKETPASVSSDAVSATISSETSKPSSEKTTSSENIEVPDEFCWTDYLSGDEFSSWKNHLSGIEGSKNDFSSQASPKLNVSSEGLPAESVVSATLKSPITSEDSCSSSSESNLEFREPSESSLLSFTTLEEQPWASLRPVFDKADLTGSDESASSLPSLIEAAKIPNPIQDNEPISSSSSSSDLENQSSDLLQSLLGVEASNFSSSSSFLFPYMRASVPPSPQPIDSLLDTPYSEMNSHITLLTDGYATEVINKLLFLSQSAHNLHVKCWYDLGEALKENKRLLKENRRLLNKKKDSSTDDTSDLMSIIKSLQNQLKKALSKNNKLQYQIYLLHKKLETKD